MSIPTPVGVKIDNALTELAHQHRTINWQPFGEALLRGYLWKRDGLEGHNTECVYPEDDCCCGWSVIEEVLEHLEWMEKNSL